MSASPSSGDLPIDASVARAHQLRQDWAQAMSDDALLKQLVRCEPPEVTIVAIAGLINGFYCGEQRIAQAPALASRLAPVLEEIRLGIQKALPYLLSSRRRLGWGQRDVDIALMRWIRRSGMLSLVLGAGVSQGAGAPGWADLVKLLLQRALTRGHEICRVVPSQNNPPVPPFELTPEGKVLFDMREIGTTWRVEREVVRVERLTPEAEEQARVILDTLDRAILEKRPITNTELLMRGAQLCYDLYGQDMFTCLTDILYSRATKPSETHRAIASLAHRQETPERRLMPGWESVIIYNFDNLVGEAFLECNIPHSVWVMTRNGIRNISHPLTEKASWQVPIFHPHGFTPRNLFEITDMRFVFSTAQYQAVYGDITDGLIDRVLDRYLANPVHVALYIGCSFTDEHMNNLLRQAAKRYPWRWHYAILPWPNKRNGCIPDVSEIEKNSAKYLDLGVQPIWVDDFSEIPPVVRSLK